MAKGRGHERFTGRGAEAPEWVRVTGSRKIGRGQEVSGATRRLAQLIPGVRRYGEAPHVQKGAQINESQSVIPATNRLASERPAAPPTSNNSTEGPKAPTTRRTWSDAYPDDHILRTAMKITEAWARRYSA